MFYLENQILHNHTFRKSMVYMVMILIPTCAQNGNSISDVFPVCLSTVDRRSRERFIESNNQIASLVEKFKIEGAAYRKFAGLNSHHQDVDNTDQHQKIPLTAYGRPGTFSIFTNIIK